MQMQNSNIKNFLKLFRLFLLVLIVATLLIVLVLNIDEINTDNFKRLLAKIDFSFNQTSASPSGNIYFNSDSLNCYETFKGGLAVLSPDGLRVYDEKGNQFTGLQTIYKNPSMLTTKKYILTYDRGNTILNISNSFATVFSKTFEGKITNASMNENGSFAVLSEIEGYKSLVSVFDTSFKESFKLYSAENYILSCDISPDNQNIAVTTLKADKANIEPGVSIYKIGNDKPFFTFAIAESAPFVIKYKSNGSFFVLTEKKAYFFSKDGKKHTEIDFEGRILQNFAYNSPRFTAFVLGEKITNKKTKIIIIDDEGNTITNQEINENVRFSSFSKSFLTLLLDNSLMLIDPYNKKSIVAKKNIVISPEINEVLISGNVGFLISGNYANIIAVE